MPDQLRAETVGHSSSFLVCSLWFKKNALTFDHWCYYSFTVTISYVITWEWWFHIHAETFLLSTKSNLMHIALWSEDDLRQLSNCSLWFLFLKETKWLECPRKSWQPTSIGITWHIQPFSIQSSHSVLYRFFFHWCASSQFSTHGTVNSMRRTLFFESDHATMSSI